MSRDPRAQFGREAGKYLTSAVHADQGALASLVKLVDPQGGDMLDIATGAGHVAHAFAPYMDRVVASDPTSEMLRVTEGEAARRGLDNIETCSCFAEDLPFQAASFDGVACRVAAHHFRDVKAFVSESYRVLRPGGWFLLVDTVSPEDSAAATALNEFESLRDPSHGRNLTVREWKELIGSAGFALKQTDSRFKSLDFQDWMDRMSVAQATRQRLDDILGSCSGPLKDYLQPTATTFCLQEAVLLAVKP